MRREYGRILDKSGVRISFVRRQAGKRKAASFKGPAVFRVCRQRLAVVGHTKIDGGEAVGKIGSGGAHDRMRKSTVPMRARECGHGA
jgi:hypothetical protein